VSEAIKSGKTFKTVIGDLAYNKKGDVTRLDYVMYVWKKNAEGKVTTFKNDPPRLALAASSASRPPLIGAGVFFCAERVARAPDLLRCPLARGSETPMTDIHDLSAVELLAHYRAKSLSPSEVFAAIEQHIARWSRTSRRSMPTIRTPRAGRLPPPRNAGKGAPAGSLDGVPVTVKENIASQGVPVPLGTAAMKLVPAAQDAPVPARLREAGAIMFSKNHDAGLRHDIVGVSSFHPLTRNPWDLSKNPGGSSSGAGAAGAAGYGPLHVGTDIGGSVRLPAGWCGLVASSRAWDVFRSIRLTSAASPGR